MRKKANYLLTSFLILTFLFSVTSIARADDNPTSDSPIVESTEPKIQPSFIANIDLDPLVKELGYSQEQIDNYSKDPYFPIKLINVFCVGSGTKDKDGVYQLTPHISDNPNYTQADLKPFEVIPQQATSAAMLEEISVERNPSPDYLLDEKCCIFEDVLDYPGNPPDLTAAADEIYYCKQNLQTAGYDDFRVVEGNSSTQVALWQWVTWAAATYSSVDVFIYGHGGETNYTLNGVPTNMSVYFPWDSFTENSEPIWSKTIKAIDWSSFSDFNTSVTVDYSTLHFGMFDCCEPYGDANCVGFEYYWMEDSAYEPSRQSCFIGTPGLNVVDDQSFWCALTLDWKNGDDSSDCYDDALTWYSWQATYPINIHDYSDPIFF